MQPTPDLWQNSQNATGISPEAFPWVVVGLMVATVALAWFAARERAHLRITLLLYVVALIAWMGVAEMRWHHGGQPVSLYKCVSCLTLLLAGLATVKLASVVLFAVILRPARLEPPPIAQDLLVALGYIGIALCVMGVGGADIRGIVATSAVLTAVIGFSLQDTLGNIMGGLALQIDQTIRVGDWIKLDDMEGRVKQIRWRHATIETRNWDTIVVPNTVLMKTKVTVLGRRAGAPLQRRQWIYFRVDHRHSPTKVIHAVESALHADTIRHVAAEPRPHCLLTDFKDGQAVFAVRYWLSDLSQPDPTDSLIRTRIYAALRRAEMDLAIPAQAITVTQEDETHRERRQNEELSAKMEALRRQDLFHALTVEERNELAPRLVTAHFVRDEAITRQGAEAHWLYIIAEGEAEVEVEVNGKTQHVATLCAGDLFGEMGLMTGEPRTATVSALTDVTCYRLGKEAFEDILRSRPEIAEQMSLTLARRRVELQAIREQLSQEDRGDRVRSMQDVLLRGIREFFALN